MVNNRVLSWCNHVSLHFTSVKYTKFCWAKFLMRQNLTFNFWKIYFHEFVHSQNFDTRKKWVYGMQCCIWYRQQFVSVNLPSLEKVLVSRTQVLFVSDGSMLPVLVALHKHIFPNLVTVSEWVSEWVKLVLHMI